MADGANDGGDDDRRVRPAGRTLVIDAMGACLLAHVTGRGAPWLFTPGGGLHPGEDSLAAARRELAEEASLDLDTFVGPVLYRRAHLPFLGQLIEARETFWVAPVEERPAVASGRLDEYEVALLGDWVWLTAAEVRAVTIDVYPRCLPDLLDALTDPEDGDDPLAPGGRPWVEVETAAGLQVHRGDRVPAWASR